MNIWQDLKERKILDKDGKVDALGPMGGSKLSGKEVSAYFRKYKVKDPEVRKAVEVALDLGGALDVAGKEIQKHYGRKIRNSKEVKFALKYANESYEINEGKSLKQLFSKYKKEIRNYNNNKDLSQDAAMAFAYWAIKNGEIKTDDPDEFDQWLDNNLPEGVEPFLDQLVKIQFNSSDPEKAEKILIKAAKKGLLGYNGPMKHGGLVGNDSFIVVGKEKDVDKVLNSMRKIMSTGRKLMNMPKLSLVQYNSFDFGDGKTLMEASAFAVMQDIVKDKQAQKIKGTMVDMFTASVVVKAYEKVNDSNKKKIEKAPLETLVKLAHKVMGMKEEAQLDEVQEKEVKAMQKVSKDMQKVLVSYQKIAKMGDKELKDTKHNPSYEKVLAARDTILTMIGTLNTQMTLSKEENELLDEWISKDGVRRRVAEKDSRKDVKEGDDSLGAKKFQNPLKKKKYPYQEQLNVMDSFRNMLNQLVEAPVLPSTMTGGVQADHSIEDGVKKYEDAINKQINSGEFAKMHKERKTEIKARKAQKYYRVETWEMGKAGSIHAFIDIETGDIFKPAGWKAPAKGARGNVTDQRYIDYVAKYQRAYHGGHLYK